MYSDDKTLKEFMTVLVSTAAARRNYLDVPSDFILRHPWTLKYLSNFAEADDFMQIAKTEGVQIVCEDEPKNIQEFRRDHGLKPQVRYKVFVPAETKIRTKEQIFKFERQGDGSYVPLNG